MRSNQPHAKKARWLTSTVFGIGMASLFSDLSHETVTSVMPALLASMRAAGGVAAAALTADAARSHAAYQDFLEMWKEADPDLPILVEARREFIGLKNLYSELSFK